MIVALTGITGNMGQAVLQQIVKNKQIEKFRFLVLEDDKRINKLLKKYKDYKDKFEIIYGNIANKEKCRQLVENSDYVINMAAVIPPHSDQQPIKAIECNEIGVNVLVSEIEKLENKQPKFIHISTVALYGNRNYKHPWARVGDPLLVSPFDIYSATKLRGEFRVLESSIKHWAILRQTAMLHSNMLADNMSDGLMFHTCFNAPLEWVTAHDSGVLIANILKKDLTEDLSKVFWKKCFNISGGERNCRTGYDILNDGFGIIGGGVKDFFRPDFNAVRNFHGLWFYDGDELEKLFSYQSQSIDDFWKEFIKQHAYFKAGKIVPKSVIRKLIIERLFKDKNSPKYWLKHEDTPRLIAYFGKNGASDYFKIGSEWSKFHLLVENKDENGEFIDYDKLRIKQNAKLIDYKFDINKNVEDINKKDLKAVAKAHGGQLLSKDYRGDIYQKLKWVNQDGEEFEASAYSVLMAGHWINKTYSTNCWEFDSLSKNDEIYAQIWYDSHDSDENFLYYFDNEFNAHINKRD